VSTPTDVPSRPAPADATRDELELVRAALRGLKFGAVVITVHDGVIAQIERTEKLRPPKR
jgi:hypothetical protein